MQSTSWEIAGLEEAQSGIKIAGRNINNLRYAENALREPHTSQICQPPQQLLCPPWKLRARKPYCLGPQGRHVHPQSQWIPAILCLEKYLRGTILGEHPAPFWAKIFLFKPTVCYLPLEGSSGFSRSVSTTQHGSCDFTATFLILP